MTISRPTAVYIVVVVDRYSREKGRRRKRERQRQSDRERKPARGRERERRNEKKLSERLATVVAAAAHWVVVVRPDTVVERRQEGHDREKKEGWLWGEIPVACC